MDMRVEGTEPELVSNRVRRKLLRWIPFLSGRETPKAEAPGGVAERVSSDPVSALPAAEPASSPGRGHAERREGLKKIEQYLPGRFSSAPVPDSAVLEGDGVPLEPPDVDGGGGADLTDSKTSRPAGTAFEALRHVVVRNENVSTLIAGQQGRVAYLAERGAGLPSGEMENFPAGERQSLRSSEDPEWMARLRERVDALGEDPSSPGEMLFRQQALNVLHRAQGASPTQGSSPVQKGEEAARAKNSAPAEKQGLPERSEKELLLREILEKVGYRQFCVELTKIMAFEAARSLKGTIDYVTDFGGSQGHENIADPAPELNYKIARDLRRRCHELIDAKGFDEADRILRTLLSVNKPRPALLQDPASSLSVWGEESKAVSPETTIQGTSEEAVALSRISLLEDDLVAREKANPSLLGTSSGGVVSVSGQWAPRAHELWAIWRRKAGLSVDESDLAAQRKESSEYGVWRIFAKMSNAVQRRNEELAADGVLEPQPEPEKRREEIVPENTKIRRVEGVTSPTYIVVEP